MGKDGLGAENLHDAEARAAGRSAGYPSFESNGHETQVPVPRSPQALLSLSEVSGPLTSSAVAGVTSEQGAPIGIQESNLSQGNEEQRICGKVDRQRNVNSLTPSVSREGEALSSSTELRQSGDNESRPESILKPHVDTPGAEALSGALATPDEQLRLEAAQSMQLAQDSGSIPTGKTDAPDFTNATLEEDQTSIIPRLEDLNIEINGSQSDIMPTAPTGPDDRLVAGTPGLRNPTFHGLNGESPRDLTLSRRPPMQINTDIAAKPGADIASENRTNANSSGNNPTASGAATPNKFAHPAASAQSPPERMSTRISSGTLRQKSISEILGETPKATPTHADRGAFDRAFNDFHKEDHSSFQTPKSALPFTSPDPTVFKQRLSELKGKDRSKLSTVVFAPGPRIQEKIPNQPSDDKEAPVAEKDYFLTLFAAKASPPHGQYSLTQLIKTAHKTLNTSDMYTDFNERQACQVLNRIHELQSSHRWSLRQAQRSVEPNRPVTHWDVLLGQMKWMRTDFREERKWKMASAKYLADACAYWFTSSEEERRSLRVRARPVRSRAYSQSLSASTPELVHSADDEASEMTDDESVRVKDSPANAPAAIFSLPPEMFIFGLNKSPIAEKLLLELPLYQPNLEIQDAALGITQVQPDGSWRKPLAPISKYAQGKIVSLQEDGPPRKRSRFDFLDSKSSRSISHPTQVHFDSAVKPEQEDVALFDPENKHIRDRIHAGHAFRPPSEYHMPSQSFFESRQSSQWTPEEDHELRKLVRDYAYNWSLISCCLTTPSMYHAQAERRTPWECFERWISLEGLPVEMAKIQYFRAYHSRLQAAQKTVEAQHQALQQAQGNNPTQLPMRRRTTQPFAVERRKNNKHIHLIDAMRKLAKKREAAIHKQQHGKLSLLYSTSYNTLPSNAPH